MPSQQSKLLRSLDGGGLEEGPTSAGAFSLIGRELFQALAQEKGNAQVVHFYHLWMEECHHVQARPTGLDIPWQTSRCLARSDPPNELAAEDYKI
jgi:hypothetical protein